MRSTPYQHERIKQDRTRGAMSARTRAALSPKKRAVRSAVSAGLSPWVWLGLIGLGGFALFKSRNAAAATPGGAAPVNLLPGNAPAQPVQAGTVNIPELPGAMAPAQSQVSGAVSFWDTLRVGDSMTSGYINFPSGSQAAATLFQTRTDGYESPYVQWAGLTWILTGPDASGNYSATQVMT